MKAIYTQIKKVHEVFTSNDCTYMEFSFRRSPAKNLHTCYKSSHAQSNGNKKHDYFKSYFRREASWSSG